MKKIKELLIIPYEAVDDDCKGKVLMPTYYYTFHNDNYILDNYFLLPRSSCTNNILF